MDEPGSSVDGGDVDEFVIDEFARRTGLTVRSLRSYQSQGLVPPPTVRGRTGYYTTRHVARVELIKDLQARGMKLSSIARLLDENAASDQEMLRFRRSVSELFDEREGSITTAEELGARFDVEGDSALRSFERAVAMDLIRNLGDGAVEELEPLLLDSGVRAQQVLGIDALEALDVLEQLRRRADAVARLYVELYLKQVWKPFVNSGQPAERWPEIEAGLHELRQLATDALVAAFEQAMTHRIDRVVEAGGDMSDRRARRRRR